MIAAAPAALITEKSCLLIDHLIQISLESLAISFFGLPLPLIIIELSSHSLPFTYYWYLYKASPPILKPHEVGLYYIFHNENRRNVLFKDFM
jgi:hypothetical protein